MAAGPSLRQRWQLALRAFINNSLLEGGDARELIKDCTFASSVIGVVPQAFAKLQTRYSTTKLPDDLNAEAVGYILFEHATPAYALLERLFERALARACPPAPRSISKYSLRSCDRSRVAAHRSGARKARP